MIRCWITNQGIRGSNPSQTSEIFIQHPSDLGLHCIHWTGESVCLFVCAKVLHLFNIISVILWCGESVFNMKYYKTSSQGIPLALYFAQTFLLLVTVHFIEVCHTLFSNNIFISPHFELKYDMHKHFLCIQKRNFSWIWRETRNFPTNPFCKKHSLLATSCIYMTLQKVSDLHGSVWGNSFFFIQLKFRFWEHRKNVDAYHVSFSRK